MPYVLYGDKGTGASCVEMALAEAGADYQFKSVSLDANEQHSPAYLAVNPSGKLPALQLPSGEVLTESSALLLIVAERHPGADLLPPQGSVARAQALRWIAFMASEIYSWVEVSDYPERFMPERTQAEALRLKAQQRLRERLLIVEEAIAGPWLLGERFCVADIYAAMFSRWRGTFGRDWLETGIPKLSALSRAVSKRPRIAPVWARHFGDQS
ncbi:MAG: glutathione S-transferase family protein [Alphaproteobacteria bacterium]